MASKIIASIPHEPEKEKKFVLNLAFAPIPEKLKSLLILIAFRCQAQHKVCTQSDASMSRILNCHERSIRARLAELVTLGLVKINNPRSPRYRTLEITPKTIEMIKTKTQEYIDQVSTEIPSDEREELGENSPSTEEPKSPNPEDKLGEDSPSYTERALLPLGEDSPSITERTLLHKTTQDNFKTISEDINSSAFSVGFQPPKKPKPKTDLIAAEYLEEIIKTPEGIQSVSIKGLPEKLILDASEVFISRFEEKKFKTIGQLQYAFIDFLQEFYMREEKKLPF